MWIKPRAAAQKIPRPMLLVIQITDVVGAKRCKGGTLDPTQITKELNLAQLLCEPTSHLVGHFCSGAIIEVDHAVL